MRFSIRDLCWLLLLLGGVLASYRWGYEQGLDELDNGDLTALVTRRYKVPFVSDQPVVFGPIAGRKDSDELIRIFTKMYYSTAPHLQWDESECSIQYLASDKSLIVTARRFQHVEIDRIIVKIQQSHDEMTKQGKTWRHLWVVP